MQRSVSAIRRACCAIATAIVALSPLAGIAADAYPSHPIRLIVPTGAGGITDILARTIAQKMGASFGQQVVVDNRPGASGIVGSQIVATAPPDGYTLLMVFPSHAVNPSLFASVPFDTVTAFAPISMVSAVSLVLTVSGDFPARTTQELIVMARAKPGQFNYGSVGPGSLGHLGAELFRSMAGLRITHVPYKGAPQVLTALIGGEINIYLIASVGSAVPHIRSGKIRALGVSTKERLAALPDVPPIADALPGYEARGWNGILAPAKTPKPLIDRLHQEIVLVVRSPEFNAQLTAEGATAIGNTPQEFDAIIRADVQKWAKVVKKAGLRAE
jgi:tripartite-type tricarboxylate transporter receptor subunit TctC